MRTELRVVDARTYPLGERTIWISSKELPRAPVRLFEAMESPQRIDGDGLSLLVEDARTETPVPGFRRGERPRRVARGQGPHLRELGDLVLERSRSASLGLYRASPNGGEVVDRARVGRPLLRGDRR